jgi:hypothetical protein
MFSNPRISFLFALLRNAAAREEHEGDIEISTLYVMFSTCTLRRPHGCKQDLKSRCNPTPLLNMHMSDTECHVRSDGHITGYRGYDPFLEHNYNIINIIEY